MKPKLIKKNYTKQVPKHFIGGGISKLSGLFNLKGLFDKTPDKKSKEDTNTDGTGEPKKLLWDAEKGLSGMHQGFIGLLSNQSSGANKATRQMGNADSIVDMVGSGISAIPGGAVIGTGLKALNSLGGGLIRTPSEFKNFSENQDIMGSSSLTGISSGVSNMGQTIDAYGSSGLFGRLIGRRKKNRAQADNLMGQQKLGSTVLKESKDAFEQATSSADMYNTRNMMNLSGVGLNNLRFGREGMKLISKEESKVKVKPKVKGVDLSPEVYKKAKQNSRSNKIWNSVFNIGENLTEAVVVNAGLNKAGNLLNLPILETAYDTYNVYKGFSEGDPKQILPNVLGLFIPGLSGKVIESVTDRLIPKFPEKEKARMKWAMDREYRKYPSGSDSYDNFEKEWAAKQKGTTAKKLRGGGDLPKNVAGNKFDKKITYAQEGSKVQQMTPEQIEISKEEREKKEKEQADINQYISNKRERLGKGFNFDTKPAPRMRPLNIPAVKKKLELSHITSRLESKPIIKDLLTSNEPSLRLFKEGGVLNEDLVENVKDTLKNIRKHQLGGNLRYADKEERQVWNEFVDFVDKEGYKGNEDLNHKDKGLSKKLWKDFNFEKGYNYNYDEMIPIFQNTIKAYRDYSIDKIKNGNAILRGYSKEQTSDPNFDWEGIFQPGLSDVDGWAGSKTTSFKFPGKTEVKTTVTTIGDQQTKETTRKKVDNDNYAKMALRKEGGTLEKKENVIVDGVLHARKHNIDKIEGFEDAEITLKGVPVITYNEGGEIEQHAEVEVDEVILHLELTKKLEELMEDGSDEAKIEAGKLLTEELLYNTEDSKSKLLI